jgi:hypothetical protein
MLDGHWNGELVGSGTVVWEARRKLAAGEIDYDEFISRWWRPRRPAPGTATPWARRSR